MLIIGVTGTQSSGKDEVAKYLISKGFKHYSCSDELRKEARKLKLPETRENLGIVIGDKLRTEFGKGILGKRTFEQIKKDKVKSAVVSSLRLIEEVNELKKSNNFYLIFVDAPIEIRYKRAAGRMRISEKNYTFEDFKRIENNERYGIGTLQKMQDCYDNAEFTIINNKSLTELHEEVDKILSRIGFLL
ncbi:MAG: AAA family ATPase [Nanoarchaeota archaeon]